jgi:hypothetical protein
MPFGKYRGYLLADVPLSYLRWCLRELQDLDPDLRREMRRVVQSRTRPEPEPQPAPAGPPATWDMVLRNWYREMSLRFHPDRGGNVVAMQTINLAYERLRQLTSMAGRGA